MEDDWEKHWGENNQEKRVTINLCTSKFSDEDLIIFKTKENNNPNFLKIMCKYRIRRYYCSKITDLPIFIGNTLYESWLYHASFTPIWKIRINNFNGIINHANKLITFNYENDEENFYNSFDYEIDEQSIELKNKLRSIKKYSRVSWKDFYDTYGTESVLQKIRIKKK